MIQSHTTHRRVNFPASRCPNWTCLTERLPVKTAMTYRLLNIPLLSTPCLPAIPKHIKPYRTQQYRTPPYLPVVAVRGYNCQSSQNRNGPSRTSPRLPYQSQPQLDSPVRTATAIQRPTSPQLAVTDHTTPFRVNYLPNRTPTLRPAPGPDALCQFNLHTCWWLLMSHFFS